MNTTTSRLLICFPPFNCLFQIITLSSLVQCSWGGETTINFSPASYKRKIKHWNNTSPSLKEHKYMRQVQPSKLLYCTYGSWERKHQLNFRVCSMSRKPEVMLDSTRYCLNLPLWTFQLNVSTRLWIFKKEKVQQEAHSGRCFGLIKYTSMCFILCVSFFTHSQAL